VPRRHNRLKRGIPVRFLPARVPSSCCAVDSVISTHVGPRSDRSPLTNRRIPRAALVVVPFVLLRRRSTFTYRWDAGRDPGTGAGSNRLSI